MFLTMSIATFTDMFGNMISTKHVCCPRSSWETVASWPEELRTSTSVALQKAFLVLDQRERLRAAYSRSLYSKAVVLKLIYICSTGVTHPGRPNSPPLPRRPRVRKTGTGASKVGFGQLLERIEQIHPKPLQSQAIQ